MKQTAIEILDSHRIMSVSTIRPDGWPQTTIVGYANEGFDIFFLIFRTSQKFANIAHDDRVSIAVGPEPKSLRELAAVYAGAHAGEITDPKLREHAWWLLKRRHSKLMDFESPDLTETALMRATCKYVSVLDFGQGIGHSEQLVVGDGSATEVLPRKDQWGLATGRTHERTAHE